MPRCSKLLRKLMTVTQREEERRVEEASGGGEWNMMLNVAPNLATYAVSTALKAREAGYHGVLVPKTVFQRLTGEEPSFQIPQSMVATFWLIVSSADTFRVSMLFSVVHNREK